jgi:O-antigen ligase
MSEMSSPITASETSVSPSGQALVMNQPGFAGLWGLATAQDSLKYWLSAKSFRSFVLSRWLFTLFFVTVTLNGFVVFNRVIAGGKLTQMPTYPIATAIVLAFVLATTKERSQGTYFWGAWSFWIFYTLVGFVNATSVNSENFRVVLESLVKSWISLIGIPWMAFRIISPDQLPRYTKLLVLTTTVGSIMCLAHTANPDLFWFMASGGTLRGSGPWENANGAAMFLMFAMFLIRLTTWNNRLVKTIIYLLLLAGFIGTFSRGAILGYILGESTYLILVKNYKRIFVGALFLSVFLAGWITLGFLVQNNSLTIESDELRPRVQMFSNIISGKASEDLEASRIHLWKAGIQHVVDGGGILFGVGHAGLIKSKGEGLASHNEYIQYFADGGLLGLTAFLSFLFMIFYIFLRCKDRIIRSCLTGMIVSLCFMCITGSGTFLSQSIGAYIAIMALWAHYSREYPGDEKVKRLKRALTKSLVQAHATAAKPL